MACRASPATVASAFHADEFVVAQLGGGMVRSAHQQAAPDRVVQQRRGVDRRDRPMGLALERRAETVRVGQDRQRHHRQGPSRTSRADPPDQIRDGPLSNRKPRPLRPRRHLRRGPLPSNDRQRPARTRDLPQPRDQHAAPHRPHQHRPSTPPHRPRHHTSAHPPRPITGPRPPCGPDIQVRRSSCVEPCAKGPRRRYIARRTPPELTACSAPPRTRSL